MQKPQINTYTLGKILKEIESSLLNMRVSELKKSAINSHVFLLSKESESEDEFAESLLDYVSNEPELNSSYQTLSNILYP